MLLVNQLIGFGATSDTGKALTFRTGFVDNTDASSYSGGSWSGISIGDAAADRYVIVGVGFSNGETLSAFTFGGAGGTTIASSTGDAAVRAYLLICNVTSGTTVDLALTTTGTVNRVGVAVWTATGLSGTAAHHTGTATTGDIASLNTLAGGFAVAYCHHHAASTSWALPFVEACDNAMESSLSSSGAHILSTSGSAVTVDITHGSANAGLVAASW